MIHDRLVGWTVETTRRSHCVGESTHVVGTRTPGTVTVRSSLCGTAGHGEPNGRHVPDHPCRRCLHLVTRWAITLKRDWDADVAAERGR